jgi:hypothetical protein
MYDSSSDLVLTIEVLLKMVFEHPDLQARDYLNALKEQYNVVWSTSTFSRFLKECDISRTKVYLFY